MKNRSKSDVQDAFQSSLYNFLFNLFRIAKSKRPLPSIGLPTFNQDGEISAADTKGSLTCGGDHRIFFPPHILVKLGGTNVHISTNISFSANPDSSVVDFRCRFHHREMERDEPRRR